MISQLTECRNASRFPFQFFEQVKQAPVFFHQRFRIGGGYKQSYRSLFYQPELIQQPAKAIDGIIVCRLKMTSL